MLDPDPRCLHARNSRVPTSSGTPGKDGERQRSTELSRVSAPSSNDALDELVSCWLLSDLERFRSYLKSTFGHVPRFKDPKHVQQVRWLHAFSWVNSVSDGNKSQCVTALVPYTGSRRGHIGVF